MVDCCCCCGSGGDSIADRLPFWFSLFEVVGGGRWWLWWVDDSVCRVGGWVDRECAGCLRPGACRVSVNLTNLFRPPFFVAASWLVPLSPPAPTL